MVMRVTTDNPRHRRSGPTVRRDRTWTLTGQHLAQLIRATRGPFLRTLQLRQLSREYVRQARFITTEFADFCAEQEVAPPWQLREEYLAQRGALRVQQRYSSFYLETDGRELRYFLRWYEEQLALGNLELGKLSTEQWQAYWSTQRNALRYRHVILSRHVRPLLLWLQRQPVLDLSSDLDVLLLDYFAQRHSVMRGQGYGFVLNHRANIVTRRHLVWLEGQGHLPSGTATPKTSAPVETTPEALFHNLVARVGTELPRGLRQPLLDYLKELVCNRQMSKGWVESSLSTNLALCRKLADEDHDSFALLRVKHLDEVVSSLACAPRDDLLRRRRQVQQHNSRLRGFLRHLHRRDLLERDFARALISPPCWRASKPPTVLSEEQVQNVLESVDRGETWGRRCYAMLLLLTTYGLRPIDVARLRLDDLHWREQSIGLVQNKTGGVVTLPLLPEVSAALYEYLRQDRVPGLRHRHVFVSLSWPHRPVLGRTVADVVAKALRAAGMAWARPRHLRASVATHLLRQGEALSTIQEVLGHRTVETTQRYAVTDVEILRQVLEERER